MLCRRRKSDDRASSFRPAGKIPMFSLSVATIPLEGSRMTGAMLEERDMRSTLTGEERANDKVTAVEDMAQLREKAKRME